MFTRLTGGRGRLASAAAIVIASAIAGAPRRIASQDRPQPTFRTEANYVRADMLRDDEGTACRSTICGATSSDRSKTGTSGHRCLAHRRLRCDGGIEPPVHTAASLSVQWAVGPRACRRATTNCACARRLPRPAPRPPTRSASPCPPPRTAPAFSSSNADRAQATARSPPPTCASVDWTRCGSPYRPRTHRSPRHVCSIEPARCCRFQFRRRCETRRMARHREAQRWRSLRLRPATI